MNKPQWDRKLFCLIIPPYPLDIWEQPEHDSANWLCWLDIHHSCSDTVKEQAASRHGPNSWFHTSFCTQTPNYHYYRERNWCNVYINWRYWNFTWDNNFVRLGCSYDHCTINMHMSKKYGCNAKLLSLSAYVTRRSNFWLNKDLWSSGLLHFKFYFMSNKFSCTQNIQKYSWIIF